MPAVFVTGGIGYIGKRWRIRREIKGEREQEREKKRRPCSLASIDLPLSRSLVRSFSLLFFYESANSSLISLRGTGRRICVPASARSEDRKPLNQPISGPFFRLRKSRCSSNPGHEKKKLNLEVDLNKTIKNSLRLPHRPRSARRRLLRHRLRQPRQLLPRVLRAHERARRTGKGRENDVRQGRPP